MNQEILDQLKDSEIPGVELEDLVNQDVEIPDFQSLQDLDNKLFAQELIKTCEAYLGINRTDNIDQISKFLKLFGLPTRLNGKWVPYCAAGLSYSAAKTYCNMCGIKYNSNNAVKVFRSVLLKIKHEFFRPTARCWELKETAINQSRFLSNSQQNRKLVKPGYVVLFNFDSDSLPDHVGIVLSIDSDSVKTIEFNTSNADDINGGAVSRRDRPFKVIQGFVKIY